MSQRGRLNSVTNGGFQEWDLIDRSPVMNLMRRRSRRDPEQTYNPDFRMTADPQKAAIRSNTAYKVLANLDCLCVLET